MLELLANHIQLLANHAHVWGFVIVFILMAIESSVIPLPSEAVLIPAGFMAYRGEFTFGSPAIDIGILILCGAFGSLLGAYANYFVSSWLGRPLLYKYGKYFFVSEAHLLRAEELFRKYGEIATFVCRLLPAIRHLISIPAGLSRMNLKRFSFFTTLGAGIWSAVLLGFGCYLSSVVGKESNYKEIVYKGKDLVQHNYIWIFLAVAVLIAIYIPAHKAIMGKSSASKGQVQP